MRTLSPGSYWNATIAPSPKAHRALDGTHRVDVAVIGAGITGLTAALHLQQAGRQVAVLEAGTIGSGTTGGTTAHLEIMPDQGTRQLLSDFGEDGARKFIEARRAAIDQMERWTREYSWDCDFCRIPAFAITEHDAGMDRLLAEGEAARRLGIEVVFRSGARLPFRTAAALEIPNQGRVHALRYLHGLAGQFLNSRGQLYSQARAQPPQDGTPCIVPTADGELQATDVIVATHSAYLGISQFDMRQAAYQSYVVAVRVEEEVPDALFWDDAEPYHYLRIAASGDPRLLLIGGADHKTGEANAQAHLQQLTDYVRQRFTVRAIEQQWSAEFFEPSDGVPFIGRVPGRKHLYLATGFSGNGMTFGTAAGGILADLVLERPSPNADVFSPSRLKPLAAATDLVTENLNAAKHFVQDRWTVPTLESLDAVLPGEGRVVHYRGKNCAVYRDQENVLFVLSPVCTHAGCQVQWNNFDRTWDCPCHGGRYAPNGQRIYGPPHQDLAPQLGTDSP